MGLRNVFFISILMPMMLFGHSYGLKDLINLAQANNQQLKSKSFEVQSAQKEKDAQESAYWPVMRLSSMYNVRNPIHAIDMTFPREELSASASIAAELYDGGRKKSLVNAATYDHQSSILLRKAFDKELIIKIVENYYKCKTSEANLALYQASFRKIRAQIKRLKSFSQMVLPSDDIFSSGYNIFSDDLFSDDIDRLGITYDNMQFKIEMAKLDIFSFKEDLKLLTGIDVKKLKESHFSEPKALQFELNENTIVLKNSAASAQEYAKVYDSSYLPQVDLEYRYSKFDFYDEGYRSNLRAVLTMKVFDHGRMRKESEALQYKKMSYDSQAIYSEQEQRKWFTVAGENLKVFKTKMKHIESALQFAKSTYKSAQKRYEAGSVGYIIYLDAFNSLRSAQEQYNTSHYEYETTKAYYYRSAGKNPSNYIR